MPSEHLDEWRGLILRLAEQAARLGDRPGTINLSILILNGRPHLWETPIIRPVEPKGRDIGPLEDVVDPS